MPVMDLFCSNCGSFNYKEEEKLNKCSFCGKGLKNDKKNNSQIKKNFLASKNFELKDLKEFTKTNLIKQLYPLLKNKESKYLSKLELADSLILCVPYSNIKCAYSFDFEYVASDLEEQAYTVYKRVWGGSPTRGNPVFGIASDNFDGQSSYTEPTTKYRTVEKNRRKITDSAYGNTQETFISTFYGNKCQFKLPDNHHSTDFVDQIILNREKKMGNKINSFSSDNSLIKFSNIDRYFEKIKKGIVGKEENNLKICILKHDFEAVKSRFGKNVDLSAIMFKEARNTSSLGDKNVNYKIWNKKISYDEKEIILDTYLIQAFKSSDDIFICSINLSDLNGKNNFIKTFTENELFSQRLLANPKNIKSKLTKQFFRRSYYLPFLIFSTLTIPLSYLKGFLSNFELASYPKLISSNINPGNLTPVIWVFTAYWAWSIYRERQSYKIKTKEILDSKLNVLDTTDNDKILRGEIVLSIDGEDLESYENKFKKIKLWKFEFSVEQIFIYSSLFIPVIEFIINSFNLNQLFLILVPFIFAITFAYLSLLILEKVLKINFREYLLNLKNKLIKLIQTKLYKKNTNEKIIKKLNFKCTNKQFIIMFLTLFISSIIGFTLGIKIQQHFINSDMNKNQEIMGKTSIKSKNDNSKIELKESEARRKQTIRKIDPRSYEPEVIKFDSTRKYTGVGIQIGKDKESDNLIIISVIKGLPAEQAGIKASDKILSIDGASTKGMKVEDAVNLLRGKSYTNVKLDILRNGNFNFYKLLTRTYIKKENQFDENKIYTQPNVENKFFENQNNRKINSGTISTP